MKKFLVLTAVIVASIMFSSCVVVSGKRIDGSGVYQTKTIALSDFSRIKASRGVKVIISNSVKDEAMVKADDNIIDFVTVDINEGELRVGIDESINGLVDATVEVTVPNSGNLRKLKASSAATIVSEPVLVGEKMSIDASSSGRIKAAVRAVECDVDVSSAAAVNLGLDVAKCSIEASSSADALLSGRAECCEIDASSASKVNARNLTTKEANLEASSASNINIICTSKLEAKASSAASIRYSGGCSAETRSSSGGSIQNTKILNVKRYERKTIVL